MAKLLLLYREIRRIQKDSGNCGRVVGGRKGGRHCVGVHGGESLQTADRHCDVWDLVR